MRACGAAVLAMVLAAGPLLLSTANVAADQIVETTDGRRLMLRSDGKYEFLSKLDPAVVQAAQTTARQWAKDQTLILYCLRKEPFRVQLAHAIVKDGDDALTRLRRAGATEQEWRLVSGAIAAELHTAMPEKEDSAMQTACLTRKVKHEVIYLHPMAWPLAMRPPFDKLK